MKIVRTKKSKLLITLVAVSIFLALGGGALAYTYKLGPFAPRSTESINLEEPTDEEKEAATEIKKQSMGSQGSKTQTGSDPAKPPQPIAGSDKSSVSMEITAANQDQDTLRIRALIHTVANTGTCELRMNGPGGATQMRSSSVQALASSSTCKGFDIPLADLTPGEWTINLNYTSETLLSSTSKKVTVQ